MATSKISKNDIQRTIKEWSNASLEVNTWYVGATLTIPAGTKALILAATGNGSTSKINNVCNINISAGTASVSAIGSTSNDAGSGNAATGWAYIEAETQVTLLIRQYGYAQAISGTASGRVVAFTLSGRKVT